MNNEQPVVEFCSLQAFLFLIDRFANYFAKGQLGIPNKQEFVIINLKFLFLKPKYRFA